MITLNENVKRKLKTGVCTLALVSMLIIPSMSAFSADDNKEVENANTQVEQNTQDQTEDKRKEIISEAITALNETKAALKALDEDKSKDALASLEKATGKLEIILVRDPSLALAPTDVGAVTYDLWASIKAVNEAREQAEKMLEDGKLQDARRLIAGLASETVISTTNLPLATYPDALKEAAKLIDEGKTEEAKLTLQTALNTLVITEVILPLPIVRADKLLDEAEKLAEAEDRSKIDSSALSDLLDTAQAEIEFAQALGYGQKEDFEKFYKEIEMIREKTSGGKSGVGFFEKIKKFMTSMTNDSQPEKAQSN